MSKFLKLTTLVFSCLMLARATATAEPSLTIYNQNFAVVRDTVPLELSRGSNQVRFVDATAYLEPGSVILRDASGKHQFRVLEQNYRGDPVTQETLLALNEGKTIEFEVSNQEGGQVRREMVPGKLIRSSSYDPRVQSYNGYPGSLQPLVEVNGKLRFGLPGQPIFPALADNTILKPTLVWVIESDDDAKFPAELSYVTGEMSWEANYNLVLPERGNALDVVGWITMDNKSGKSFDQARIKLMAGDVNKIQNQRGYQLARCGVGGGGGGNPPVSEKSFDEYHLYTLEHQTTLHDQEKKQVEFVRAAKVESTPIYVYDGMMSDPDQEQNWIPESVNFQTEYGTKGNKKVWVMREFANSERNHLGLPLPKGRVRVYRRNTDGQLEFTGENIIKHTPRDEVVRLFLGNAFDIAAERVRTDFKCNYTGAPGAVDPTTGLPVASLNNTNVPPFINESFEIHLRNHKTERVEVRVVEHLYRWINWEIKEKSDDYKKTEAQTVEFRVALKPNEERKVSYSVHYWW